jgi:hypothetical protein
MAPRATITGQEAADRLAIRELIDASAHCADRRDAKGQTWLFAERRLMVDWTEARQSTP